MPNNLDLEVLQRLCPGLDDEGIRAIKEAIRYRSRYKMDCCIGVHSNNLEAIVACIVRLGKENEPLRQFAEYCLERYSWHNEPDGGDLQEKALELGLVELRKIDREDPVDGEDEHYFCKWTPKAGRR